jgi:hypothetical protein
MLDFIADIMPGFLANMVAKESFWWAILASLIVGGIFNVFGLLVSKANNFIGGIVQFLPSGIFSFYIWHIREHTVWLIFAILGVLAFFYLMAQKLKGAGSVTVNSLQAEAAQLAVSLPVAVDEITRLDKVWVGPGLRINYSYTLTGITAADPELPQIKINMGSNLLNNLRNSSDIAKHRKSGVIFCYSYMDTNGALLMHFEFGLGQYS